MGGRGSSTGISVKGMKYGSEYHTVYKLGNIKFVKNNFGSATAPQETMTQGRVYVTLGSKDELKSITYYDKNNKRFKQIDLTKPHFIDGVQMLPHTHIGYYHDETGGTHAVSSKEQKMVERVTKLWNYHLMS